jgi:hypothetical protein
MRKARRAAPTVLDRELHDTLRKSALRGNRLCGLAREGDGESDQLFFHTANSYSHRSCMDRLYHDHGENT